MINHDEMKILFGQLMEEVSGYKNYRECAERWQETAPMIAEKYAKMSEQELRHAETVLEIMKAACEDNPEHELKAYHIIIDFGMDAIRCAQR